MPIKANLAKIKAGAVLSVVKNGHGAYESVTVFVPFYEHESASKYESVFGDVDIVYSWRATHKMLSRKKSGFYTGVPLKGETFVVTDTVDALKQAESLVRQEQSVAQS